MPKPLMERRLAALAIGVLLLAPSLASAQPRQRMSAEGKPLLDADYGSVFKCDGSTDLVAKFDTRDAKLIAIVDAGDGPHELALKPWAGGAPDIIWSDGQRTLTWSPGVQLMWMDHGAHRMCGRGGGHEHQ